ncbi:Ig-like domain-containing protein [Deinococcus yavapaiensis]|uniref:Ig-like protein group 3 n=1 Tax=Deinococcus yavapaiensis KR-236 TaxID=694435 RepID=A0A318S433_9DEIO|nr:Ig-like domain-containing protein [Deinococcus yavapaiensis]PYE53169.1 Ig-like protein group 3 [Deinococcus yavapaiensis KR-236]
MKRPVALAALTLMLAACTRPTIDLSAPSATIKVDATTLTTPGTVTLTSKPTDNVGVTRVEFYKNGILLDTDTSAPYTTTDTIPAGTPEGPIRYSTRAYDAAGNVGRSGNATLTVDFIPADTTAPTVTLTAAPTTVTTAGPITLAADASDNVGVSSVQFYRGGVLVATDTTAPYEATVNVTSAQNGTVAFRAVAKDAEGNSTTSGVVNVTVNITDAPPGADTTAPTVELTAPTAVVTTAGAYDLSVVATDNVGVARVEFYQGTTLLATDTTNPYQTSFNVTSAQNGTLAFTAKAYDAAGNVTTSTTRNVTVNIPTAPPRPDTTPPTVDLTAPSATITSADTYTLTARATDDVGVTRVEFYRGATLLETDSTTPYEASFAITSADNGTLTFTAKAYDAAGNVTMSGAQSVTVDIPPVDEGGV